MMNIFFFRDFKLVYENKIKGNDIEQDHLHEEADTLILNQIMVSSAENFSQVKFVFGHKTLMSLPF